MIRIDSLSKRYGPKVLFQDTTYHFPSTERVALVGANGAGKTTLLKIMCGIEDPDAGTVLIPNGIEVGYLPQVANPTPEANVLAECVAGARRVARLKERMDQALAALDRGDMSDRTRAAAVYEEAEAAFRSRGGWSVAARAQVVLRGLRFRERDLLQDPRTLSPGWRMRLELARLLVNEPDFLILDEPTNHLDLPSLVWVEKWLLSFRGTLLFVSHDRSLLNRLATTVLHLSDGRLTPYAGNFDAFLEQREARAEQQAQTLERMQRRREELEGFVRRFGAKASKAKQAQSRVKMIQRLRDLEAASGGGAGTDGGADAVFALPELEPSGRDVLTIRALATGYSTPLHQGLNLDVSRGQRVAVIGANGVGKSTLLKTIAGNIPPLDGSLTLGHKAKVSWFAQDQLQALDPNDTVIGNLRRSCAFMSEKEARSLLGAFLFRGDDVFKPARVLSGGETSRLGLACVLSQGSNVLLLDEPTNHLDMTSAAALLQAIDMYDGTVLFVSHDRTFVDGVATHVLALADGGRSLLVPGNLADFERMAPLAGFPNVLDPGAISVDPETAASDGARVLAKEDRIRQREESRDRQRERARLEKRLAQLDETMRRARQTMFDCEDRMATYSAEGRFSDVTRAQAEFDSARKALETAEEEWLAVAEALEKQG